MKSKVKYKYIVVLGIILLGLVFRLYHFDKLFMFAHDQDLYSWIAKDIIINKHLRTVGQITSVDGVFIGPAYYYLMAIFYWILNMNPLSAVIPITIIGVLTIYSFFLLGTKYFSTKIGLILASLYSLSWGAALFDRWSVPTQPTILWSVWFLYIILGFLEGNIALLPVYGVLVGLVYHIHIALLPILPLPIFAYFIGKGSLNTKIENIKGKNIILSLLIFMLLSSPFWVFEIKHNFSQIKATIHAMQMSPRGPTGVQKIKKVMDASGREWQQRWLSGLDRVDSGYFWLANLLMIVFVLFKKKLNFGQSLMIFFWIILIMLAQFTSKRIVSEYYFTNLTPIFFLLTALFVNEIFSKNIWIFALLTSYGVINIFWMIKNGINTESYYERYRLVDRVKMDAISNSYPCIGINYIANFGTGVGFRYLFWYEGVNVVKASDKVPVYNIVIPWETSEKELDAKFGRFGLILPKQNANIDKNICRSTNNQLDPLLGYTE